MEVSRDSFSSFGVLVVLIICYTVELKTITITEVADIIIEVALDS